MRPFIVSVYCVAAMWMGSPSYEALAQQGNSTVLKPNPAVEQILRAVPETGELVPFRGLVGPSTGDTLRLYVSLTLASYYDIPRAAIVYAAPAGDANTAPVTVYVRASTPVVFGHRDSAGVLAGARTRLLGGGSPAARNAWCLLFLEQCLAGSGGACAAWVGCSAGSQIVDATQ